ncbi:hypothetical protein N431DRAFT_464098 [Stipitochalara longipes BDJ]|nr:hypothetical protein N431DRAFT_464098 [Stipitochalara longipes BDJ]
MSRADIELGGMQFPDGDDGFTALSQPKNTGEDSTAGRDPMIYDVLVGGSGRMGEKAPESFNCLYHAFPVEEPPKNSPFYRSWHFLHSSADFLVNGRPLASYFSHMALPSDPNLTGVDKMSTAAARQAMTARTKMRRLIVTKSGLLGLAPVQTQPGDAVIAIAGYGKPVIARKVDTIEGQDFWYLIGEAYVRGMMNSEKLQLSTKPWYYQTTQATEDTMEFLPMYAAFTASKGTWWLRHSAWQETIVDRFRAWWLGPNTSRAMIAVLKDRSRKIFMSLFWSGIVIIIAVRTGILTERARDILQNTSSRQSTIDHLHNVYFGTIALVECTSAFFLLKKLAFAHKTSIEAASGHKLFAYLMRSTEIRVAMLALIGFSRTITYSFQTTAQSATTTAGQLDRFVTTLECLFPEMMFIDILASRLIFNNRIHESSSHSRSQHFTNQPHKNGNTTPGFEDITMYPVGHVETRIDARGIVSTSQEQIIDRSNSRFDGRSSGEESQHKGAAGNIVKTVEFEFHDSAV